MNSPVKKKLSGLAIASMIGAILFAIAAACMIFLPVTNSENQNALDVSVIGKEGGNFMKLWSNQISPNMDKLTDLQKTFYTFYLIEVIAATVAFFGMILCGVLVLLGKALNFKHGGRVLALLFSIFGLVISGFFLVWTIVFAAKGNEVLGGNATVGIGPILMTSFAFVAFIFSCLAVGDRSALKTVGGAPVNNGYYNGVPGQNTNPPAPVAPQNMGYVGNEQFAPQKPLIQQPAPTPYAPQQPAPRPYAPQPAPQNSIPQPYAPQAPLNSVKAVEEAPTIAQVGAIEGVCGQFANAVINLKPNEKVLIGRDPSACNIVIASDKKDVSRTHCSVKYDPYTDSFKVIDMSSNGTFVGSQKLVKDQETQFPAGTVLSLGSGENQFRLKKV